jgi:hypothetical protein
MNQMIAKKTNANPQLISQPPPMQESLQQSSRYLLKTKLNPKAKIVPLM